MRILFRDNLPLAEYVLRIITGKDDLHLTKEETQKDLVRLVGARGLCLDVHGIDHASALDVENLSTGQEFEELPTTYIIFITENDIWGAGQAVYPVSKTIAGLNAAFEDRQHVLYVNASYKGDDPIGYLMHDFLCSDPDEMLTPILAEKARFLKTDPKGVDIMCKAMDELREQSIKRGEEAALLMSIKNIMEGLKYTAQQAMDLLKIPASEQPKYLAKL